MSDELVHSHKAIPNTPPPERKGRRMNVALNRQQVLLCIALAIITLLIVTVALFSIVGHINVLHALYALPNIWARNP